MNDRIKELAEQAWDNTAVSPDFGHPVSFAEKFAELIVRECSKLFEVEWGNEKLTGNDVGYVLKKHFGVE